MALNSLEWPCEMMITQLFGDENSARTDREQRGVEVLQVVARETWIVRDDDLGYKEVFWTVRLNVSQR